MTNSLVDTTQVTSLNCNERTSTWTLFGDSDGKFVTTSGFVEEYTDGYQITSTITPAATAADTLVGACAEYIEYIDQLADFKNGVPCHAVVTDTSDATAIAANGHFLFLIPMGLRPVHLLHHRGRLVHMEGHQTR